MITIFYDGQCPLCAKEIAWLQQRATAGRILFQDISVPVFNPQLYGKTMPAMMAELHVLDDSDRWHTAMDATRLIYKEIGLGWVMAPTKLPGLRQLFDWAYATFAKLRPRLQKNHGQCEVQPSQLSAKNIVQFPRRR